jgi:branched-chain amino acid transport system substrate-binding protein
VGLLLTACGGNIGGDTAEQSAGEGGATEGAQTLTIGYVSPTTGPLAAFGESDAYVVKAMTAYFAANPISAGGKTFSVKIVVRDAQSTSTRAGEVAAELINSEGADLLLASSTPDIVNPVSEQCEANSVPCLTTVAPWQPFAIRGQDGTPSDLAFSHHFFWGLEDIAKVYSDMWKQVPTNGKAAGLFPNDPDGQAWSANLPGLFAPAGYTLSNPGLYPNGTQDFSAQISKYSGFDIVTGVPIPPDFTTFWKQAQQQGFKPKVATIAKAVLFPSAIEALGGSGAGISTEVWWHPTAPYTSSVTGQTAQQLADAYEQETSGQWTQPLGFSHALFEVAAAALTKAGSTDAEALNTAMDGLSVDTVVGPLAWGADPALPPYVARTPLAGGQWRASDGDHPYELVVVSNVGAPTVPVGGKLEPIR